MHAGLRCTAMLFIVLIELNSVVLVSLSPDNVTRSLLMDALGKSITTTADSSLVADLFEGVYITRVRCEQVFVHINVSHWIVVLTMMGSFCQCGNCTERPEAFIDLDVSVKGLPNLTVS